MKASSEGDVVPDFDVVGVEIVIAYTSGIWMFLLTLAAMVVYHRVQLSRGTQHQEHDLDLIIRNVKLIRLHSLGLIALQLPLLSGFELQTGFSFTDFESFMKTAFRPILYIFVFGLGIVTNSFPLIRWIYILCLLTIVALDTIEAFYIFATIDCASEGLCNASQTVSGLELDTAMMRLLASIGLEVWSALVCIYLMVSIGCLRSRYPLMALSTSRQYLRHRSFRFD